MSANSYCDTWIEGNVYVILLEKTLYNFTVMADIRKGVSGYRQLHRSCYRFFSLSTKSYLSLTICEVNQLLTCKFPAQRAILRKVFPCVYIYIQYCTKICPRFFPCFVVLWLHNKLPGPFSIFCPVRSDYAQPITGQVTEITCPVIGRAQHELTPSKGQKTSS